MNRHWSKWLIIIPILGVMAWLIWRELRPGGDGEGFASSNGRIEAIEVDVATKLAGRIAEILVDEGDFVTSGQVLARMDTIVLEAQLAQAKAQVHEGEDAKRTAEARVVQQASEKTAADAVVDQRQAELTAAQRRFARIEQLVSRGSATAQELDDDRATLLSAQATLAAARSQVTAELAGIEAARSKVTETRSAIEAARAGVDRVAADINDSLLKAPRDGRVQFRVAQVSEVLPVGGKVLNMVDLSKVYMTFFLPAPQAGRIELGQEVRLVIDALPQYVIPAKVTFVDSVAQFTPKTVETASEREKLMFRIKAYIAPDLLRKHETQVKTGVPGMAYLRLDSQVPWPNRLQIQVPK